jgi:hypothetical protein
MSCYSCTPNESSIEYTRRRKPENNQGCGCGNVENTCETPSQALEGSPLYEWEQIYGKLVTTVKMERNPEGKMVQVVEKKPCPPKSKPHTYGCTSTTYRINR